MSKFTFNKCDDLELWDHFVDQSPQGSVFNKSAIVSSISNNVEYFIVKQGNEVVAATSVILDECGKIAKSLPFMQYVNGFLFRDNQHQLPHKIVSQEFKLSTFLIDNLLERYNDLYAIHNTALIDIRPFLWTHYDEPEKGQFNCDTRYTAILSLKDLSETELVANCRTARRQEYKKAINFPIKETDDIDILDDLHQLTFERQGIKRSDKDGEILRKIIKVTLDNNLGRLSVIEVDGQPASANLFLYDEKSSYYLFGANHPDFRNTGASTKLMIENIFETKRRNLSSVDFVGVNSPNRGDYKISFNANLLPYFRTNFAVK